jgi:hypothetical protein
VRAYPNVPHAVNQKLPNHLPLHLSRPWECRQAAVSNDQAFQEASVDRLKLPEIILHTLGSSWFLQ